MGGLTRACCSMGLFLERGKTFDLPVQWTRLVFAGPWHLFARRCGTFLGISLLLVACSAETKIGEKPHPGIPVRVGTVLQKNVPVQLRAIGSVEAYSTVSIKSMVGGEIYKAHFKEGQEVKKDDLLFTIDPRPFEAALKQAEANLGRDTAQVGQVEANLAKDMAQVSQAEANLAKDLAQAENARKDASRYKYLVEKGYVAHEQYDQVRTNAEALEATVRADKAGVENAQAAIQADKAALENAKAVIRASAAAVENARIQLGYCYIRSPMNGRTGSVLIQQGNVVKANDLPIVVINQINPIYVTFSVPEKNLPEIKKYRAARKLKVEAIIAGDEQRPEQGILTFVDNTVDATTGTIRLKGTFENKEKRLWPGQFVNAILTLTEQLDAIVVPSQAVQMGQQGQYAFVVKPDLTVESRPLVVSRMVDGETVITQGLKPGEKVVTDGQLRLVPGAKVEVKSDPGKEKDP
jgi:multidrug efflux system membrane fusion protein